MQNSVAIKKVVAVWTMICLMLQSFAFAVYAEDENISLANVVTEDSKLVFDGFTLQYGVNGKIQALVDVSIENIDATGVDFTLNYDSRYIVPSDFDTNDIATDATNTFKANTEVFADEAYLTKEYSELTGSSIQMNLVPDPQTPNGEYIGVKQISSPVKKDVKCILSSDRKVSLGQMSFQIVDPVQVCNMTQSQLNDILSIKDDNAFIMYVGDDSIEYFVDVLPAEWKVVRTLLDVTPAVKERTVTAYSIYNRCSDITKAGTLADLVAYLNQTMNVVDQRYSDGQQVLGNMIWNADDPTFEVTYSNGSDYNPLGNEIYTVSQNYGGTDKVVTVKVTVTPVTITGFKYDNKILTYTDSSRPATWDDLKMPDTVTPVLDGTDDMYVPPTQNPIQTDWTPYYVTDALKNGTAPVSETYTEEFDKTLFGTPEPAWLTIPDGFDWNIKAIRNVLKGENDPFADADKVTINAEVERETGILDITVTTSNTAGFEDGTNFNIYLPNGMVLKTTDNNDFVTVSIVDGKAIIKINAMSDGATSITLAERELIQSIINLGNDDFKLSAIPPDNAETTQIGFAFNPRVNYYLGENGNNYVEKDYSAGRASMFPVYEGQSLADIASYISFPDKSTIPIAYHGQTGYQPSEYDCAKVISWSIEGDPTATELPAAGTTVTLVGKLEDYSYTNFGYVQNPDEIYLKIQVTTLAKARPTVKPTGTPEPSTTPNPSISPDPSPSISPDPSTSPMPSTSPTPTTSPTPEPEKEEIKITTNVGSAASPVEVKLNSKMFEYDTKKVGYTPSDVQKQMYTIENVGTDNINGLTLRISDFVQTDGTTAANSSPTSFVNSIPLYVNFLNVGDKTQFEIRTKRGLPAGEYSARVSVGSNKNAELAYFNIHFKVTENEVYTVTVDNGDSVQQSIGLGYLMDETSNRICSRTYEVGETVPIYVQIIDSGYTFDKWETADSISFANATQMSTTFTMIAQDVTVKPTYRETNDVWVRLADLRDYNENETTPNDLRDSIPPYAVTTYNETTYAYRVIVDGSIEKNFVEFDLKNKLLELAPPMTVTATANGNSLTITPQTGVATDITTYKSDLFELNEGLNTVKIKTEYTDTNDGLTYSAEYTLTILRKKAVDVDIKPGNSPYGLIESSDNITDKATAKELFSKNHTYDSAYTPNKAVKTYDTKYYTDAWSSVNYDENPYTLFVYNGQTFVDPGFENLKDMDGNSVAAENVTRTIEVQTVSVPTNTTDIMSYTTQTVTVTNTGASCVINELASLNIRPGVYTLKYTFTDADNTKRSFTRPVVVLAEKGDVNLDRTVDSNDADMLYQRMNNGFYTDIINSTEEWAKIYAYRVADVTEDRNVNSIDANALSNTSPTPYYESLPTTVADSMATFEPTTAVRQPIATVPPDKATLTLDYLGTASKPLDKPQTPNLTTDNIYDADNIGSGIVWFGISIKNTQNLKYFLDGLYSMDFAIDYDSEIFTPCDGNVRISTDTGFNLAETIESNNIKSGVTTSDIAYWDNAELYKQSLQTDLDIDSTDNYKTEFVTIKSPDGNNLRLSDFVQTDGYDRVYLLRVPFRLNKIPDREYVGKPITINLTEQTFVMGATENGVSHSASWEGDVDKTTEVNNAKNHFDGVEIVDIFNTDGKYNIIGTVKCWNDTKPVTVEVYKDGETTPMYTFTSSDTDDAGNNLYGVLTKTTKKGECEWNFELPVSNQFSYKMIVKKQSHLTYPEITIDKANADSDAKLTLADTIEMIVGDINGDEIIKLPDRAELMRFFNRQKPWILDKARFEAADLNGDGAVNMFDLTLLKQNMEKTYPSNITNANNGGGSA